MKFVTLTVLEKDKDGVVKSARSTFNRDFIKLMTEVKRPDGIVDLAGPRTCIFLAVGGERVYVKESIEDISKIAEPKDG